jgi:hypothetical protein
LEVPDSVKMEHEELHRDLRKTSKTAGYVGAGNDHGWAKILHPSFRQGRVNGHPERLWRKGSSDTDGKLQQLFHISPDTLKEMVERAQGRSYNFPYVKDEERVLARSLGATNTPHVFVFDAVRKLRYKGRIDNARQVSRVTSNDLRDALDDILAGKEPRTPETVPFGCSIVW